MEEISAENSTKGGVLSCVIYGNTCYSGERFKSAGCGTSDTRVILPPVPSQGVQTRARANNAPTNNSNSSEINIPGNNQRRTSVWHGTTKPQTKNRTINTTHAPRRNPETTHMDRQIDKNCPDWSLKRNRSNASLFLEANALCIYIEIVTLRTYVRPAYLKNIKKNTGTSSILSNELGSILRRPNIVVLVTTPVRGRVQLVFSPHLPHKSYKKNPVRIHDVIGKWVYMGMLYTSIKLPALANRHTQYRALVIHQVCCYTGCIPATWYTSTYCCCRRRRSPAITHYYGGT